MGKRLEVKPGDPYGRLTVIEEAEPLRRSNGRHRRQLLCRCACGKTTTVLLQSLTAGLTESCGCLGREASSRNGRNNTTHGLAGTPIYNVWRALIQRCHNPNDAGYPYYGERGVQVCERWRTSFEAFFEDMGPRPSDQHSVERRENDGNYEQGNCYWATRKEQARNTRRNRMVTLNGKTMCLSAWAEEYGVSARIVFTRICTHKWSVERALTTPVKKRAS